MYLVAMTNHLVEVNPKIECFHSPFKHDRHFFDEPRFIGGDSLQQHPVTDPAYW